MKRWTGTVVVSYTQTIEVEAETQEEAEMLMCERFDDGKAYANDWYATDVEEVKE